MINIYQQGGNEVILIGRDRDGKRVFQSKTLTPYFYTLDSKGKYKDLFGNSVKKIETNDSWEVSKLRKNYSDTFESDIFFVDRVMIDTIDKLEKEPLRICYFDMENYESLDCENTPEPITCICAYDNFKKKQYEFLWHKTYKGSDKLGTNIKTFIFDNEPQMLRKFIKFICSLDFDILTGWNVEQFDMAYIINRCKKLGIKKINDLSMKGDVYLNKSKNGNKYDLSIKGRYVLDLLEGYKKLTFHALDSYKLNDIAKIEVKDTKLDHEENFKELWENNPVKLLEYCSQDVMLCVKIDEKKGIINYFDELRRLIVTRWENLWNATRFHDIIFLRKAKELGVVLPRKTVKEKIAYGGGFVGKPTPGLHKNIFVMDLVSLYPNIIKTFNLSPETISPTGNILINGIRIDENKPGICSMIIDDILTKRFIKKKEMKDEKERNGETDLYRSLYSKQYALKVVANSLYGALGTPYFRMFRNEIAERITFLGRTIIKWSNDKIKEYGYKVVYNDTDSCFVYIPDDSGDTTFKTIENKSKVLQDYINDTYDELVKSFGVTKKHSLKMVAEELFSEIFFGTASGGGSVKKRYAGNLIEKGKKKLLVKGFEVVRSDASTIERLAQKEVFKMILDNKTKEDVDNYINEIKKDIKNGKYKPSEIAIRRGIKKISHKDVYTDSMTYSNKYLGTHFSAGCKIKMLFVIRMPEGYPPTRAISFENDSQIPDDVVIDWKQMFRRMFDSKMDKIYTAMGWINNNTNVDDRQVKLF